MGPLSVCDTLPQTFTKQTETKQFLVPQPVGSVVREKRAFGWPFRGKLIREGT
jgi:hypothetical protein